MSIDIETIGGDGLSGGEFGRAKLLGMLTEFLLDPINLSRARTAMLSAPSDDQELLNEALDNLQAGIDPGEEALDAVISHARIFCGFTVDAQGRIVDDTGFVDDDD